MKKFLFLLVAIPLSAESMERTGQGLQLPQRRNAQRPPLRPLPRLEEETTLAVLQLAEGGRSQSPVLVDQQPGQGDSTQKIRFKKDEVVSCYKECAWLAGLLLTSFGLSIIFAWVKDCTKKTDQ